MCPYAIEFVLEHITIFIPTEWTGDIIFNCLFAVILSLIGLAYLKYALITTL